MLGRIIALLSQPLKSPRGRFVVAVLVLTGLVSILIGGLFAGARWVVPAQVLLAITFVLTAALTYTQPEGRLRLIAGAAPAIGALLLGWLFLPNYFWLLVGLGTGWFVAALFLFRQQQSPEVLRAIRHMRKGRYKEGISELDEVIKRDRDNPEHFRLRAMLFRLDGRLDRARRDYEAMLERAPDDETGDALRAEAYDGLAEVHLQGGQYDDANEAARLAHELYPDNWVPLYNLGLINDRREDTTATIEYLERAFDVKIADRRQRLLAHLYLARAYHRDGNTEAAEREKGHMSNMWGALEDLEKLVNDEQSAALSAVLADDLKTARALMVDELKVHQL